MLHYYIFKNVLRLPNKSNLHNLIRVGKKQRFLVDGDMLALNFKDFNKSKSVKSWMWRPKELVPFRQKSCAI